jgi:hypothetical protein
MSVTPHRSWDDNMDIQWVDRYLDFVMAREAETVSFCRNLVL